MEQEGKEKSSKEFDCEGWELFLDEVRGNDEWRIVEGDALPYHIPNDLSYLTIRWLRVMVYLCVVNTVAQDCFHRQV